MLKKSAKKNKTSTQNWQYRKGPLELATPGLRTQGASTNCNTFHTDDMHGRAAANRHNTIKHQASTTTQRGRHFSATASSRTAPQRGLAVARPVHAKIIQSTKLLCGWVCVRPKGFQTRGVEVKVTDWNVQPFKVKPFGIFIRKSPPTSQSGATTVTRPSTQRQVHKHHIWEFANVRLPTSFFCFLCVIDPSLKTRLILFWF